MVILGKERASHGMDSFHMLLLLLFYFAIQHIFVVQVAVSIPMSLISFGYYRPLAPPMSGIWQSKLQ